MMLFLTRKVGESIIIDDQITLTISEIRGNIVKLSFDYPNTRRILRKEIHDRIQQENLNAAAQSAKIKEYLITTQKPDVPKGPNSENTSSGGPDQSDIELLAPDKRAAR